MDSTLIWGTPALTLKGAEAVNNMPASFSSLCQSVLRTIDGEQTFCGIRKQHLWAAELDTVFKTLIDEGFIVKLETYMDKVKELFVVRLGSKRSQVLITKINHLYSRYGDAFIEHLSELESASRMFFGEDVTAEIMNELAQLRLKTVESRAMSASEEVRAGTHRTRQRDDLGERDLQL